jgi:hypothetical protein
MDKSIEPIKLCVDCKHFGTRLGFDFCDSPANGISPVNGRPKPKFAEFERSEVYGKCGPAGINFEPIDVQVVNDVQVAKRGWFGLWRGK